MKWYFAVWKNYAGFRGRATRSEYWYFVLFNYIAVFIVAFVCGMINTMIPYFVYLIAALIPSIAVAIRRVHDTNKSAWLLFVPIYNLVLMCTDGTAGENKYGHDPKRPEFDSFLQDAASN